MICTGMLFKKKKNWKEKVYICEWHIRERLPEKEYKRRFKTKKKNTHTDTNTKKRRETIHIYTRLSYIYPLLPAYLFIYF